MDTERTRDTARRYLKCRMRLAICQAKVAELGDNDPVWAPLAWLATGFEQEALQEWRSHARGKPRAALMPHIMEALHESLREAPTPYRDKLPPEWLDKQLQGFLATFDPDTMLVPEGAA